MNKKFVSLFVSVIISITIILGINELTIVDDCLKNGGHFYYETGKCLIADNQVHVASFTSYLIALYFFIAIGLAFGLSRLFNRVFKLNQDPI